MDPEGPGVRWGFVVSGGSGPSQSLVGPLHGVPGRESGSPWSGTMEPVGTEDSPTLTVHDSVDSWATVLIWVFILFRPCKGQLKLCFSKILRRSHFVWDHKGSRSFESLFWAPEVLSHFFVYKCPEPSSRLVCIWDDLLSKPQNVHRPPEGNK